MQVIILFFIINGFYIIPPISSNMIAPILVVSVALLLMKNPTVIGFKIFKDKNVASIFLWMMVMFLGSLLIPYIFHTVDISYAKNFVSQFIQFFVILFFLGFCFNKHRFLDDGYFERLIVYTFCLQSIIQILAYIFPPIATVVHLTYTADKVARLYEDYGGARGLALTGAPGWGISVGYALSFMFYIKAFLVKRDITFLAVIIGLLLFIGAALSGRSAFVGVIFGLFYFIFSCRTWGYKFKVISIFTSLLILSITSVLLIFPEIWTLLNENVLPYVLELFYNLQKNGQLASKSTDILIQMWDVDFVYTEALYGTGWFIDPLTGGYVKDVDVGYLRNLFFGGAMWLLAVFLYQAKLLSIFNPHNRNKDNLVFNVGVFLMLTLMEFKAMTVGFNKYAFTITLFYSVAYYFSVKHKAKKVNDNNISSYSYT